MYRQSVTAYSSRCRHAADAIAAAAAAADDDVNDGDVIGSLPNALLMIVRAMWA